MFDIREELLHPALSHFPIVLFLMAFMTRLTYHLIIYKFSELAEKLKLVSTFLLYASGPFYLISLFLGDMSFDLIKKDLCNLIMVYKHEEMAEIGLIFVITSILFEVISSLNELKKYSFSKLIPYITLLLLFGGSYTILETSHLGGKLVYEEGAAVNLPKNCSEN